LREAHDLLGPSKSWRPWEAKRGSNFSTLTSQSAPSIAINDAQLSHHFRTTLPPFSGLASKTFMRRYAALACFKRFYGLLHASGRSPRAVPGRKNNSDPLGKASPDFPPRPANKR
jgi:hypothetical protein